MPAPKSKADIGLYITPEVFTLPLPFTTRGILAEIQQLSKRDGVCTAADAHFVDRFDVSRDTVSRAIQQLAAAGHISKEVDKSANNLRRITPTSDPQNQAHLAANSGEGQAANSGAPSRKFRRTLAANSGVIISKKDKEEDNTHTSGAATRRVGGSDFQEKDQATTGPAAGAGASTTARPGTARNEGGASGTTENGAPGQPAEFAAFWETWPTKQRRKDAATAFGRLSLDDQQAAASRAATWLRQHPRQVERGAVPFPASWLSGEQWHDGPEPTDRSPKPGQPAAPPTHARTSRLLKTDDLK